MGSTGKENLRFGWSHEGVERLEREYAALLHQISPLLVWDYFVVQGKTVILLCEMSRHFCPDVFSFFVRKFNLVMGLS